MATLLTTVNSLLFVTMRRLVNEVAAGKAYTKREIIGALPCLDPVDTTLETALTEALFYFPDGEEKAAALKIPAKVPIVPTLTELRWLRTMLGDEKTAFLLTTEVRRKLTESLSDIEPFSWEKIFITNPPQKGKQSPVLTERLTVFWQALQSGKKIRYQNKRHGVKASPCRLEYDATFNRYRFIMWQDGEKRAVKINPVEIAQISLLDEPVEENLTAILEDFLTKHRREVILRIKNIRGAVERCFYLLSPFDKDTADSYSAKDGSYRLGVWFYDFDYEEILERILAVGAGVTVLSPPEFQNDVICRLEEARKKFVST